VARILACLAARETIVIHCVGGLGRTGTIAACCLAALGQSPEYAIDAVRAARPGAIQTSFQERFVPRFAAAWRKRAALQPRG
jgi:protein-tyrosine phosphatase